MGFSEDMFALGKTRDWQACHRRIDEEEPGSNREERFSIAYWRSAVFKRQGRYDEALRVLDASRADVFSQCGYRYRRAQILCLMGRFAEAIETLRDAPFAAEIDTFPGMAHEAMFLYCYLLIKSGREAQPNLLAAIPDDFGTMIYDGRMMSKTDLLRLAGHSPSPASATGRPD